MWAKHNVRLRWSSSEAALFMTCGEGARRRVTLNRRRGDAAQRCAAATPGGACFLNCRLHTWSIAAAALAGRQWSSARTSGWGDRHDALVSRHGDGRAPRHAAPPGSPFTAGPAVAKARPATPVDTSPLPDCPNYYYFSPAASRPRLHSHQLQLQIQATTPPP